MKKILTLFAILFLTTGMIFAQTNVFFSEYIEGSGNNKALEIYNGGSTTVDLTQFNILTNYNGNAWSGMYSFPTGTTLAAGDVYVIANSSADSLILAVANETLAYNDSGYIVGYNGDDVRALVKIVGTDTTIIDIIGAYDGVDPGAGWAVGDTADATKDHTLVRKSAVTTGQTDWAVSAGTDDATSEWEVYPKNTFDYIGQHPGTGGTQIPDVFFSEYIEGSGNNKALEIYNGGSTIVDLTQFNILTNYNGNAWSGMYSFPTGTTLAAGDVYVIANSSADSLILAVANETLAYNDSGYIVGYNGDDVRALVKIVGTDTTIIDIIGAYDGVDPGSGWAVGDTANATKDHSLVRKATVTTGQADWAVSAGTDDATSEWVVYPKNTFDYLGQHPGTGGSGIPNLFISEYIEGSSNNKAMEIYNAENVSVDLSQFVILQSSNGGGWQYVHDFPAGAGIASNDVWVIITDAVDPTLFDAADADEVLAYPSVVHFNGDDARALAYINGVDTTIVDIIGVPDVDPGSGWDVAGITNATKDHSLVRKETVTSGQTDWTLSAGTNATDSEWEVYDQNTFEYLGQHPGTGGGGGLPVIQSVSRDLLVPNVGQSITVSAFAFADNGLASVDLVYSTDGIGFTGLPMTLVSDSTYSASIPGTTFLDTTFTGYFVIATDNNAQSDSSNLYGFFAGTRSIGAVKSMIDHDPNDSFMFSSIAGRVRGVCTAGSNNFSNGRIEAYLQDTTAAIKIFSFAGDTPEMVEGNDYTVTGILDSFHGQGELVPQTLADDIVDNGASTVPDPLEITISDLLTNPEYYESMLITINDAALLLSTPWPYPSSTSSSTLLINDGGTDSLALRIDSDTDIITASEPIWPQNITGLVTQFDDFQILPRRITDFDPTTGISDETSSLPKVYTLSQNYPNPFNPTTTIKFSIPKNGFVTLDVFDMLGRKVRTLVNREMQASFQTVEFDASSLASGVYVYRLKVNNFISAKKLLLMK